MQKFSQKVTLEDETKVGLLYALKAFTERATGGMTFPVKRQKTDAEEPEPRAPKVYLMRLPDMTSFDKKAPFILHQIVTGEDAIVNTRHGNAGATNMALKCTAAVRTVFCVYHPDEQEGALALLTLMEQMRLALLTHPLLRKQFDMDMKEGVSQAIYPDNGERGTAPFYLGEMVTEWNLPPVQRLDAARVAHGLPARDPHALHLTGQYPEAEDETDTEGLETDGEDSD